MNDNIGATVNKPEVPLGQMPSFHFQRFSTHQTAADEVKSLHGKPTVSKPAMESPKYSGDRTDETARSQSAGKKKGVQVEVGDLKEGLKKKASSRYMEKGGLSASAKQAWGQWAQYQADAEAAKAGGSGIREHNDDDEGEEVEEEVNNFEEEEESSDEAKSVGEEDNEEEGSAGSHGGSIYEDDDDESEEIVEEEEVLPIRKTNAPAAPAGVKVHYSNESKSKDKSQTPNKPIHRPKVVKKKAATAKHSVPKEHATQKEAPRTKIDQRQGACDDNDDDYSNIFDEDGSSDEGEIEEWFQLKLPKELSTSKEKGIDSSSLLTFFCLLFKS